METIRGRRGTGGREKGGRGWKGEAQGVLRKLREISSLGKETRGGQNSRQKTRRKKNARQMEGRAAELWGRSRKLSGP